MGFSKTLYRDSQYLFFWWRKRKSRKNYHLWWEPGALHAVLSLFGWRQGIWVLGQYLVIGEPLWVWNPGPVLDQRPILFSNQAKDKMHALLFKSHLLTIVIEQIHLTVIAILYLKYKQNEFQEQNQVNRACHTLFINQWTERLKCKLSN